MPGFRWLTVGPPPQPDLQIVLLKAGEKEKSRVGQGTTWVLQTADCRARAAQMKARGVKFVAEPHDADWGASAMFVDLHGNPYNLLQPKRPK